jgi:hypothetical protein
MSVLVTVIVLGIRARRGIHPVVMFQYYQHHDEVIKLIASRCAKLESGGRMIDSILTNTVLPKISEEFFIRMVEVKPFNGWVSRSTLRMASLGMGVKKLFTP